MKKYTLERYVVRDFVVLTLITFVSLLMFFSLFYLADYARIVSEKQREFTLALKLTGINLPILGALVGDMTVIFALFILGAGLARRGELVAMYAAGISPLRLYTPVVVTTGFFALLLFWSNAQLLPRAFTRIDSIVLGDLGRWNSTEEYFRRPRHWYRAGNRLIRLNETDQAEQTYYGLLMFEIQNGHVTDETSADKVQARGGQFLASGVTVEHFPDPSDERAPLGSKQFAEKSLALPETFNAFLDLTSRPEKMNLAELRRVFALRRKQGYNPSPYEVEYYTRLFGPLNLVALVIVGLSFAFEPDVKRSIFKAGSQCVAMVVTSFFLNLLFRGLSVAQTIPAALGALAPAVSLLAFACYRQLQAQRPQARRWWRRLFLME